MSKFGLMDPENTEPQRETTFTERLAAFSPVKPRSTPDLAAMDSAAAQHGFVSREVSASIADLPGRRRRAIPSEPTRHLAIRLSASAYSRFVAYADRHKLTYHEAVIRLMDEAER